MISCTYRWVVSSSGLSEHKGRIVVSRRRSLWGVPGLAGVFIAGVVTVAHGQSSPVFTAPTTLDKGNGSGDRVIAGGTSGDCSGNSIPDDCEGVAPFIIQHPGRYQIACVGDVATFTVVADGCEPLSYQWRESWVDLEDGGNVTGATTPVLTIDPVGLDDAGYYRVVVSNDWGTVMSDTARLRTMTCPPEGPKFSVVAVRINGTCVDGDNAEEHCTRDIDCDSGVCGGSIAPTDTVLVSPGDKIQCEVFASDWSWEGTQLTVYEFRFDTEQFRAVPPAQGELIPYRGLRPCQNDLDCLDLGVTCMNGFCDIPDDRAGGLFIGAARPDYVFFDLGQFAATDFSNCRFAATIFDPNDGPVYTSLPKYVGTLILTVSDDASGVFTVDANTEYVFWTYMLDVDRRYILPLEIEPLTIRVQQRPKPGPSRPSTER